MRKRTEKEKEAMGRIVPVLESLKIKKSTRSYVPLLDVMSYAAAYPDVEFRDIIEELLKQNSYVGVNTSDPNSENQILPAMVRTVETAFERGNSDRLKEIGMSEDIIVKILDSDNYDESDLLQVLGEKYKKYTHEERIVYYFIKKVLKYLGY